MALARRAPWWQSGSISSDGHGQRGRGRSVFTALLGHGQNQLKRKTPHHAPVFSFCGVHVTSTDPGAHSVVLMPSRDKVEPQSQVYVLGRQATLPGHQVLTAAQGSPCRFDTHVCADSVLVVTPVPLGGWRVFPRKKSFMKGPWESLFGVFQGWFVISFTSGSLHTRYLICATSKWVHRETTQHQAQGFL